VKHGRYICISNPRCFACQVKDFCAYQKKNLNAPKNADDIVQDTIRREALLEKFREQAI
jgi:adenine-specific DNA glycosylase